MAERKCNCDCAAEVTKLRAELVRANRRATTVRKSLVLPEGTQVLAPSGAYGVIGKDGLLVPASVVQKAAGPGQTPGTTGKFVFTQNDPRQERDSGALPNSSAPLPRGRPSFSRRPDPGRLFGPVGDRPHPQSGDR